MNVQVVYNPVAGGGRDTPAAHGLVGGYTPLGGGYDVGASFETYQSQSDGFKQLDNGGPTGFEVEDYEVAFHHDDAGKVTHLTLDATRGVLYAALRFAATLVT